MTYDKEDVQRAVNEFLALWHAEPTTPRTISAAGYNFLHVGGSSSGLGFFVRIHSPSAVPYVNTALDLLKFPITIQFINDILTACTPWGPKAITCGVWYSINHWMTPACS